MMGGARYVGVPEKGGETKKNVLSCLEIKPITFYLNPLVNWLLRKAQVD